MSQEKWKPITLHFLPVISPDECIGWLKRQKIHDNNLLANRKQRAVGPVAHCVSAIIRHCGSNLRSNTLTFQGIKNWRRTRKFKDHQQFFSFLGYFLFHPYQIWPNSNWCDCAFNYILVDGRHRILQRCPIFGYVSDLSTSILGASLCFSCK